MKRQLLLGLLLIFAAFLSACTTDDPICDTNETLIDGECVPIECDEDEVLVDGECQLIICEDNEELIDGSCILTSCDTGFELIDGECIEVVRTPLEVAIATIKIADNYRLDIDIDLEYTKVTMEILFDDNVIYYNIADEITYFEQSNDLCYEYERVNETYEKNTVACSPNDAYNFYLDFNATWFEAGDEYYELKEDYYVHVNAFFNLELNGATVENFYLFLDETNLDKFTYTVNVGEDAYDFTMLFSEFGLVEIELPSIEG